MGKKRQPGHRRRGTQSKQAGTGPNRHSGRKGATQSSGCASPRVLQSPPVVTGWRLWVFRLIALTVIPAMLLVLLEVSLRAIGYGYPTSAILTPPSGRTDTVTANAKFSWRFFPPQIARVSDPFYFSKVKQAQTYRIFILGESAAAGVPDGAYCFGRFLETMLRDQYPETHFEVITTGMPAINSHAILEITKDCARYAPDLFIAYVGNNEVVGPYGAGTVFAPLSDSLGFIRFDIKTKTLKIRQLLSGFVGAVRSGGSDSGPWEGLEMFLDRQIAADDPRMETVYRHFRKNMEDIRDAAVKHEADILFCTVGSNLKDCPPFASQHFPGLTKAGKAAWDQLYQQGIEHETAGDYTPAINAYLEAETIDGHYADLLFRLGRCYEKTAADEDARNYYIRAREQDTLRFRADAGINRIIRDVSGNRTDSGIYLLDTVKTFDAESPHQIAGQELFYEHVHLNFNGNYLLAKTICEKVKTLLPDQIRNQITEEPPVLSLDECARRLAYTDWERFTITQKILNRFIKTPPFTNQLYHEQQVAGLEQTLRDLAAQIGPDQFPALAAQYRWAVEHSPDDWFLHKKCGDFLLEAGPDNYQAAIGHYQAALEQVDHYTLHVILGGALGKAGDVEGTIRHSNRALEIYPYCVGAYSNLALAYHKKGNEEKAIAYYYETLKMWPTNDMAYNNLGPLLRKQGKIDEAIALYQKAVVYLDDSPVMHHSLGCVLADQQRDAEAIKEFKTALEIAPDFKPAQKALDTLLDD